MKILRLAHNAINPAVAVAKFDVKKDEKVLRFMVTHTNVLTVLCEYALLIFLILITIHVLYL